MMALVIASKQDDTIVRMIVLHVGNVRTNDHPVLLLYNTYPIATTPTKTRRD